MSAVGALAVAGIGAGVLAHASDDVIYVAGSRAIVLPPLPYPPDALEPVLDKAIVQLHHDKHQRGYVEGTNATLSRLEEVRRRGYRTRARRPMRRALAKNLAYNAAGAILHELYWNNLTYPGRAGFPSTQLQHQIARDFGGLAELVEEMEDVAIATQGSGWSVLAWSPELRELVVLAISNHENGWIPGVVPLLVIDVWEHAYYSQYDNRRGDYVSALWDAVDWNAVSRRYEDAR